MFCGHLPALKDELTAEENLASLVALAGEPAEPATCATRLASVALDKQADCPRACCRRDNAGASGSRASSLTQRPLWLLDEPATALDTEGIALLTRLLGGHLERGGCAVAATHQPLDLPAAHVRALALS